MHLQSIGAAETVTGSGHYLELGGAKLLIDCGLFQGSDEQEARNREPFPFEAAALNAVLLTHAHLDHVGRLPLLHRQGFRGPIYCTPPTAALVSTVLLDSARLQQEAYSRELRWARRGGHESQVPEPLYDEEDVHTTLALLRPQLEFGQTLTLGSLAARAERAGHILGSAFLVLTAGGERIVFSGDLGNRESGLQQDFTLPPEADAALIETLRDRAVPDSRLHGTANLLVMPNLDAANISFNLLKAGADGLAIGPILLGMSKPIHVVVPSVTARGIVNRLIDELGAISDLPPKFPFAVSALAPLRAAAESAGRTDFSPLWCGQNASGCRDVPAAELTRGFFA